MMPGQATLLPGPLPKNSLRLDLKLEGPTVSGAMQYGGWKIAEAIDDKGESLIPPETDHKPARIDTLLDAPKISWCVIHLDLGHTSREATKIAHLRGTVDVLAPSKVKVVEVPNIKQMLDKPLRDPAFEQAGLRIRLESVKGSTTQCVVRFDGNRERLRSVELANKSGAEVLEYSSHPTEADGTSPHYEIVAARNLDSNMVLWLFVAIGQKSVTVPFDLKDIALP